MTEVLPVERQMQFELMAELERAGAITPTSLALPANLPFAQYESIGVFFGTIKRRASWLIGDWMNYGEGTFGEKYAQAMEATGLEPETLANYASVCGKVAVSRRRESLSFGVHASVASLPPAEQTEWLKTAEANDWKTRQIRQALREARGEAAQELLPGTEPLDTDAVKAAAEGILRDAVQHTDGINWLVPAEDIARLRGALGLE